jgi:hypothetical protein
MQAKLYIVLAFSLMLALPCLAGDIFVSGPVAGVWTTGITVHVTGPAYVPVNKSLLVEEGVFIYFDTPDRFVVDGNFSALGTSEHPISLICVSNWQGFKFESDVYHTRQLHYVQMYETDPLPMSVITANSSLLSIENCRFYGNNSCLEMVGGRLWASYNTFASRGLYSRCVKLDHLFNDIADGCSNPVANHFNSNMIIASVPRDAVLLPVDEMTAGLWLEGTTNICLNDLEISVESPGSVVGAYFGRNPGSGQRLWILEYSVITVTSYDSYATGVINANEGSLRLIRCDVDVARIPRYGLLPLPICIMASQSASVLVNSCKVLLDNDGYFFAGLSGAQLDVDYVNEWRSVSDSIPTSPGSNPINDGNLGIVNIGATVFYANPEMNLGGIRGHWNSDRDVFSYYSLRSNSPCIDRGDVRYGNDPDNSLPDIGRYYYQSDAVSKPGTELLPRSVLLNAPYPNPFNATSVIPYVVNKASDIRLSVVDILGREAMVLASGKVLAGSHAVVFNAANLPSGHYFVKLELDGKAVAARPVTLLK